MSNIQETDEQIIFKFPLGISDTYVYGDFTLYYLIPCPLFFLNCPELKVEFRTSLGDYVEIQNLKSFHQYFIQKKGDTRFFGLSSKVLIYDKKLDRFVATDSFKYYTTNKKAKDYAQTLQSLAEKYVKVAKLDITALPFYLNKVPKCSPEEFFKKSKIEDIKKMAGVVCPPYIKKEAEYARIVV